VVVTAHVDPVRLDAATGEERRGMIAHAAGCRACRRAIAAHDPALLFALLADAPIPHGVLEAISAGTARGLAAPTRVSRMPAVVAAAAAVAVFALSVVFRPEVAPTPAPAPALGSIPRAGVEVQDGAPVSQVVDFTVGDTQVVMVYNPELDL
jgi:hypothetical protein